LLTYP